MRRRLLLGLLALVLCLSTVEAGLQVLAAAGRQGFGRNELAMGPPDAIRILCVGDSHTYGAGVERSDAYPPQLQARLAKRLSPQPVRVINAGFPGVNSAFVRQRLEAQIEKLDPALVLVWVGANNRWNSLGRGETAQSGAGASRDPLARLHRALLHLKLYRYATVLVTQTGGESSASADLPWQRREEPISDVALVRGIRDDIRTMVGIARSHDVPIVFVTYPLHLMAASNAAISRSAAELGVPVVETSEDFRRARRDGYERRDLIVNAAGPHPSGLLYAYVSETLESVVAALLAPQATPDSVPRSAAPSGG